MLKELFVFALLALAISACANPLNQVTSDNYAATCAVAEANGKLSMAEEACYRALVNVDMGNLGPELKSQRLYNLGRIKRRLTKFAEAEQLLKQSLALEEKISGTSSVKVARRIVELSVNLAAQSKWSEGAAILLRVLATADQFSGQERSYIKEVLLHYSKELKAPDQEIMANAFRNMASSL